MTQKQAAISQTDSQASAKLDCFSPLFSCYNGAMLGFFAYTAQFELAKPQFHFVRTRMQEFLDIVAIPLQIPTTHKAYARRFLEFQERLAKSLAERAPGIMPWFGLGLGFVSSSFANVGMENPNYENWEVAQEILEHYGLPKDLFDRYVREASLDDNRGLDFQTIMNPALQFLQKIIESFEIEANTCFVAMPFAKTFVENFPCLYRPLLEANGYRAFRAWGGLTSEFYLTLLMQLIAKSGAVLADVTGPNTSVVHEVGIAHGMGKPTILIANSKRYHAPANLQDLNVMFYTVEGKDWREQFLGSCCQRLFLNRLSATGG